MKAKQILIHKLAIAAVISCLVTIFSLVICGQDVSTAHDGIPEDWSHHHVVFSDPGTFADAWRNGKLDQWTKITSDPRYQIQQLKRNLLQRQMQAAPDFAARMELVNRAAATANAFQNRLKRPVTPQTKKDWSMNMGLVGGSPATITGTVSAAATGGQTLVITNPNTSTSVTLTATPSAASASGSFSTRAGTGATLTITSSSGTLVLTAGTTNGTCSGGSPWAVGFNRGTTGTSSSWASGIATVLASATTCSTDIGVTATANSPSNGDLTITANTAGTAGNSITVKWGGTGTSNFTPAWTSATDLAGGVAASNSGTYFEYSSTAATEAGYIATAIANNGSTVGVSAVQGTGANTDQVIVTATSDGTAGNSITITNGLTGFSIGSPLAGGANSTPATMGAGQYPAKYSFSTTTASCADYVIYGTGVPGNSSQASIIAYTDLYTTTCGSTVPTIKWAYDTGGTAALSPVLSGDGSQVAYIQTVSSVASLVVLKMTNSGGTASAPAAITSVAPSAYSACTAPCYTTLSLGANDTNSAPFYDYKNDVVYVGDDSGNLHQLSHVFNETATNYLTSVWSTNVSSADGTKYGSSGALSSPVLDPITSLIFVGDRYGYLHSVNSSGGGLLTSDQLGNVTAGGPGINDAPWIDVGTTTSNVYVFVQNTNSSKYTYINEFPTGTSINASYGTAVGFSGVNGTQLLYDGAYDNLWYTSGGASGNLYLCGVDSTNNAYPTLFQVALPLVAGTNPTSVHAYATLTNAAAGCSPPSEFYNGTTDYLFVSVTGSGTATGCTGACMYSFILPDNTTTHSGTASAGLSVAGGSSGIVVDNNGSATGESQIYFTTLAAQTCGGNGSTGGGPGGCAVQASQSGLH